MMPPPLIYLSLKTIMVNESNHESNETIVKYRPMFHRNSSTIGFIAKANTAEALYILSTQGN